MDFVYALPFADVPGHLYFIFLGPIDILAAGRHSKKILLY